MLVLLDSGLYIQDVRNIQNEGYDILADSALVLLELHVEMCIPQYKDYSEEEA